MVKKALMNFTMVALFAIAGVMLVPAVLGYHRYIILTGSMTGTYDPGSLVFDKPVPTSTLKVGDPITYAPPPGASPNQKLVTHRIWKVLPGPNGQRAFITKGDANPHEDAWKFTLPQPTQDEVKFSIPYVGYIFMFLSVREFRTALIGIPALLMGAWLVLGMWRDGGQEIRRRREGVKPWGTDIAKRLPALAPLAERAAAAARATVRLPVTWPTPEVGAGRGRIRAGFASPLVKPRTRASGQSGVVALPAACVAGPRRVTERRRTRLASDWKLVVDPSLSTRAN
ncbi:MAG: signal peptidase [Solirubrobacterales bacterium]|nr:signal peptidase [Solirubrobacterales bacterium]